MRRRASGGAICNTEAIWVKHYRTVGMSKLRAWERLHVAPRSGQFLVSSAVTDITAKKQEAVIVCGKRHAEALAQLLRHPSEQLELIDVTQCDWFISDWNAEYFKRGGWR